MKIKEQNLTGHTNYYHITADLNDDSFVEATLIISDYEDMGIPEYELTINESDRDLTDKEMDELRELAIKNI